MSCKAEGRVTISSVNGIHVRPASQIVKEAKSFESDITFEVGGQKASAKSLFKLQALEMNQGAEICICAEGSDAKAAVESLIKLVESIRE